LTSPGFRPSAAAGAYQAERQCPSRTGGFDNLNFKLLNLKLEVRLAASHSVCGTVTARWYSVSCHCHWPTPCDSVSYKVHCGTAPAASGLGVHARADSAVRPPDSGMNRRKLRLEVQAAEAVPTEARTASEAVELTEGSDTDA
jgi:hypothetical protein